MSCHALRLSLKYDQKARMDSQGWFIVDFLCMGSTGTEYDFRPDQYRGVSCSPHRIGDSVVRVCDDHLADFQFDGQGN